jgi:hypothetical protein
VLVYGKVLISQVNKQVLFFKLEYDEDTEERYWKQYNQLDLCGSIYYIRGNTRIQVITDAKIYFYLIDKLTLEPTLENVMKNYMVCSQMMFGPKVRFSIAYKTNENSYTIFSKKYEHDFKSTISNENFEKAVGLELSSSNHFLVTQIDKIFVLDQETYEIVDQIPINLF